jgi:DNA-directed RNA polymerase subunit RPC12/RpoP
MCWSAKWHGKREIMFDSLHDSPKKTMVKGIHELLEEADVVVHYNGQRFDVPRLNGEFLLQQLDPPSQYRQLDLLKTTRSQFGFASNKLDYVVQQLEIGSKVKHLGMDLWRDCMDGCDKAWRTMKRYNIQDVKLLEKYYKRILPWIKNHPNWGVYIDAERPTCRNCGSKKVIRKGVETTNTYKYQRYKCSDCGTPLRGRKSLEKAQEGITV